MQKDIAAAQSDIKKWSYETEKMRALQEEHLAQANQEAQRLTQALDDLHKTTRQTGADVGMQLEKAVREVEALKGVQELYEQRFVQLEAQIQVLQEKAASDASVATLPHETTLEDSPQPALGKAESLQEAQKLFKKGTYQEAYNAYTAIAKKWPKSAGTTDAALYGAGESLAKQNQWHQAMAEYSKVIELFPQSEWVDDCYYKIGLCAMETKNYEDAQIFFNEIVTRYKKSAWVKQAQIKLQEATALLAKKKPSKKTSP